MSLFSARLNCSLAAGAVLIVCAHAGAAFAPGVQINLQVSDGTNTSFNPTGTLAGGDVYNYQGSMFDSDWALSWDFNADATPAGGAFIGNDVEINNLSATETLEFHIDIILPLDSGLAPGTTALGSVGFTLVGIDGMLWTTGSGQSLWEGSLDGTEIGSLFDHPGGAWFTGESTASSSDNLPSDVYGPTADSIGIRLNFTLTPEDSVTFTGIFGVLTAPTPSALALLALGGIASRRRRR